VCVCMSERETYRSMKERERDRQNHTVDIHTCGHFLHIMLSQFHICSTKWRKVHSILKHLERERERERVCVCVVCMRVWGGYVCMCVCVCV